jgi:hypothetical protein
MAVVATPTPFHNFFNAESSLSLIGFLSSPDLKLKNWVESLSVCCFRNWKGKITVQRKSFLHDLFIWFRPTYLCVHYIYLRMFQDCDFPFCPSIAKSLHHVVWLFSFFQPSFIEYSYKRTVYRKVTTGTPDGYPHRYGVRPTVGTK